MTKARSGKQVALQDFIRIEGARQNNLKNLSLSIPLEKMVCITGPSGSGKSSLAFDTLYAEGHRRYVESLSTYARQFFEKVPKPDVDSIENISPAIALEQRNPVKNSRSTLGTTTEVYDYVRLLFSKVAEAFCPNGHGKIASDTSQSAADEIIVKAQNRQIKMYVGYALSTSLKADALIERGFLRRLQGVKKPEPIDLEDERGQVVKAGSLIVVDRLAFEETDRARLIEALESSFFEGHGEAFVYLLDDEQMLRFSSESECKKCEAKPAKRNPLLFSFNSPLGACDHCKGFGNLLEYDQSLIVPNPRLPLRKGALEPFSKKILSKEKTKILKFCEEEGIDVNTPFKDLSEAARKSLLFGKNKFLGAYGFLKKMEAKKYKLHVRVFLRRYQSSVVCPTCGGARLKREALWYQIQKKSIFDLCQMSLGELEAWFKNLKLSQEQMDISKEILRQIQSRLHFLNRMGVEYLNLHRLAKTLSGGETQRINLANQLGAELSGTLYVLDEPSIGLHARDRDRLLESLEELVQRGNSVVVVEHDLDTIKQADEVIELGPQSGRLGGQLIFQGSQSAFQKADTLTAKFARGEKCIVPPSSVRDSSKWLSVQGASENNLKDVSLNIPLNRLVGISGVSGSGKSTLIHQTLYNALARLLHGSTEPIGKFRKLIGAEFIKGVTLLDQSSIGKSSRSIPLSVVGGYDELRKLMAQVPEAQRRGYGPGHFSFNVGAGRCETCMGEGQVKTEMYFLDDLYLTCEDCNGKRFRKEILEIKLRGKSIHEILEMSVREAREFFGGNRVLQTKFQLLEKVGLGYLQIGQRSSELSGGESQRLKIATEVSNVKRKGFLYILDEPTTGLHVSEIELLLELLNELVDSGNSVVVIEHHLDVLKSVDWLVDLGPEAGAAGGQIVGEGPPSEIARLKTPTGLALRDQLSVAA